jgi:hypothetical protein
MCKDALTIAYALAISVLLLLAGQLKDIALKILLEVRG